MISEECELWTAVLHRAIKDLGIALECGPARRWFGARSEDVGGFNWVCDALNLDAGQVLAGLRGELAEVPPRLEE